MFRFLLDREVFEILSETHICTDCNTGPTHLNYNLSFFLFQCTSRPINTDEKFYGPTYVTFV